MNNFVQYSEELAKFCKLLYDKGYIAGIEGNLSVRLSERQFLITPRGLNKGFVSSQDMVVCDPDGKKLKGIHDPSSEVKIHAAVYKKRSDVDAICHAHPIFATAFSLAGESFDKAILPEFVALLGIVPLVRYATPGSEELALNLIEVLDKYDAFLLEKHGSLALGRSMMEAFNRTEILERYAKILYFTRRIGKPIPLSQDETDILLEMGGRPDLRGSIAVGESKS
jgi:L-fuculose-phosphate aldolase